MSEKIVPNLGLLQSCSVLARAGKALTQEQVQAGAEYYRIGVEIGGGGGIDPDLRQLYVVGSKDRDSVYYKCFANSLTEEVVAVYRFHRSYRFHRNRSNGGGGEGELHVVGRGNRAGLRHCSSWDCTVAALVGRQEPGIRLLQRGQ